MKKITIGRGRECDVRLSDNTDKVSRKHAVITVSPTGKMKIYDTSSNGTFVNGEPVIKPEGKPIRRGDNVNFARMVDLDWNMVKNPYKNIWLGSGAFLIIVLAIAVIFWIGGGTIVDKIMTPQEKITTEATDSISPVNDSLKLATPKEKRVPVYTPNPSKTEIKKVQPKQTTNVKEQNNTIKEKVKQDEKPDSKKEEPVITAPKPTENSSSKLDELMKDK